PCRFPCSACLITLAAFPRVSHRPSLSLGCAWALVVGAALGVVVTGRGVAAGASSRDYPGPCTGEMVASGVPLFLAADYHGANPVYGVVILSDTGPVPTRHLMRCHGFVVVRVGPDSALCTVRGRCTPDDLLGLTEDDVDAVRSIPGEVCLAWRAAGVLAYNRAV